MLGVRKSGLGVRISLLGKESMVLLLFGAEHFQLPARVTPCAPDGREKAWCERGRREDEINQECASLAGEFKIPRPLQGRWL
jgi:hypothetical protein